MSHYNSGASNSWQNRANNSSNTSSLFNAHDLVGYGSSQLNTNQNSVSNNQGSLVGGVAGSNVYTNPAASLLAQFAVNSVNFSNLAATLPAALVNANVLAAANLGAAVAANNPGSVAGYQWHPATQTNTSSLGQSNNSNNQSSNSISSSNLSNRSSDQRIVSIGNGSSNSGSSNYKSSSSSSNIGNSGPDVRPLMEIDTIRRNNNASSSGGNSKAISSKPVSSSSSSNSHHKNGHSMGSNNGSSSQNKTNERDRDHRDNRDRDRNDRSDVNNRRSDSSSSSSNKPNLTITTTNLNAAANSLAAANPLAQALLNQLAAQSTTSGGTNSALVAAIASAAAANVANVVTQQQQQQQQQQQTKHRASRSPSSSSSRSDQRRSSTTRSTPKTPSSSSYSHNHSSSSSHNNATSSSPSSNHKRDTRSRSPQSSSSASKRTSNNGNTSSSSSTSQRPASGTGTGSSSSSTGANSSSVSSTSSNRYAIKLPKYPIDVLTNNVSSVKSRYNQLYIPSDFINSKNTWHQSLPMNRTLKFSNRCLFHVMRKEAHPIEPNNAVYDAPDADHTWTVKVMLLAMPNTNELLKRTCSLAEESIGPKQERIEHPSKVIQFLVGNKGKHELMALGGAWSASLDGPNPATNTQTLINTAIRTVKSLTGIDLTACTQWFRFLDIQYNRNEDFKTIILPNSESMSSSKVIENSTNSTSSSENLNGTSDSGKKMNEANIKQTEATLILNDDRDVETTVIFLPNIWSLMPSSVEYQKIVEQYKNFIENPPEAELIATAQSSTTTTTTTTTTAETIATAKNETIITKQENETTSKQSEAQSANNNINNNENNNSIKKEIGDESNQQEQMAVETVATIIGDEDSGSNEVSSIAALTKSLKAEYDLANGKSMVNNNGNVNVNESNNSFEFDENDDSESKLEPTHYSKLDLKKMKVDELRTELMARDMDTRGLKGQLIHRLKEALDNEREKEESVANSGNADPETESNNVENNIEKNEESTNASDAKLEQSQQQQQQQTNETNENSDVVFVNDCDIDLFQINEKETKDSNEKQKQQTEEKSSTTNTAAEQEKAAKQASMALRLAKYEREKMYKLPQSPHVIVHPSKTAKSGKFECQMVSLSHLLDYRKDDNKESSFEVSIFAECFNEMLVRDFGFIIYKHLLSIRTDKDKELFALAATANSGKRKLSVTASNGTNSTKDEATDSESKRAKSSETIELAAPTATESKEEAKKEELLGTVATTLVPPSTPPVKTSTTIQLVKPKPKTVYGELLLAFTFFDVNKTNHISEKDLEDLLLCIGLSQSRSKVKALIKKLNLKDGILNYRTLTDKLPKEIQAENECAVKFRLPSDDEILSSVITYESYMRRKNASRNAMAIDSVDANSFNKETGIVELNGSTIDVLKTLKNLEKTEQTVQTLDTKLREAQEEMERLKTQNRAAERYKQKLSDELNDYKKKLRDQLRNNKEIDDKYIRFKECLTKTKSNLNKLIDDVSDTLKRGQPNNAKVSATDAKVASSSATSSKTGTTKTGTSEGSSSNATAEEKKKTQQEVKKETSSINASSSDATASAADQIEKETTVEQANDSEKDKEAIIANGLEFDEMAESNFSIELEQPNQDEQLEQSSSFQDDAEVAEVVDVDENQSSNLNIQEEQQQTDDQTMDTNTGHSL